MPAPTTTILFGACDRHNLGDLLFPHITAALLTDTPLLYAGLATRDMRAFGGHAVTGIAEIARELGSTPVNLIHVGGEILTCSAQDAALMLMSAREMRHQDGPMGSARAPYVVAKRLFANPAVFVHNAVGGAALDHCDAGLREEVAAALRAADVVSVRDRHTQHSLAEMGIDATLTPDPGVMVAELFAERIAHHQETGAAAEMRRAWPAGFLAVQFSSDFADDASLDTLAAQFDRIVSETHHAVVFFRAGAAPMHDDLDAYRKVQRRMRHAPRTDLFESLNIWDICALIAGSQGFVGSSLHGRIVALAHGLPRVTLSNGPLVPDKHLAFIEAWEDPAMPGVVSLADTADAASAALRVPRQASLATARRLAALYRNNCAAWLTRLA